MLLDRWYTDGSRQKNKYLAFKEEIPDEHRCVHQGRFRAIRLRTTQNDPTGHLVKFNANGRIRKLGHYCSEYRD